MNYFGKYRAFVHSINDPQERGRIRVVCPRVLGDAVSNWCEPCMPLAFDNGGDFALPKVGEAVWVEFEEGDPNKPIYTGGWWSSFKTPSSNYSDTKARYIVWGNNKITLHEDYILVQLGDSSIRIEDGAITLDSDEILVNQREESE